MYLTLPKCFSKRHLLEMNLHYLHFPGNFCLRYANDLYPFGIAMTCVQIHIPMAWGPGFLSLNFSHPSYPNGNKMSQSLWVLTVRLAKDSSFVSRNWESLFGSYPCPRLPCLLVFWSSYWCNECKWIWGCWRACIHMCVWDQTWDVIVAMVPWLDNLDSFVMVRSRQCLG